MANENDIFQDDIIEAEENIASFLDENDELFNLLGMSEEEKEKASQALMEEDKHYNDNAVSEEDRLNNMLHQPEQTELEGMSEQDGQMNLEDMLGIMESDSLESMLNQAEQSASRQTEQANLEDMLNQVEQLDLENMPEQTEQVNLEDILSEAEQTELEAVPEQVDLKEDERVDSLNNMEDILPEISGTSEEENLDEAVRALIQDMDNGTDTLTSGEDELANLDSLNISDEVMAGIDFNEDLTNSSTDGTLEVTEPSNEETNWLKKKEEKAQKKEEKRKAKEAKKKAKRKNADETQQEFEAPSSAPIDEINLDQILAEGETQPSGTDAKATPSEKLSFGEKLSLALFGSEEEEQLSAKEIARLEEKQAAKEKKKEEKAQKKAEAQQEKAQKKAQAKEMAVVKKAAAQDKKEQIRQQEEEEDAKEKKFTSKQVSLVAVILALLACIVVLGTNQFNYHMVIARATNYFEMQKYRKAYEQIVGVDVKDRDQLIRDKIYCVMYVQQQVDSYRNFCKLEMYDSGLDSLVKGFRKYNKHYAEAKELGIEADLDRLRATIENELTNQYSLSIPIIEEWLALDQTTYTQTIRNYVASMQFEQ